MAEVIWPEIIGRSLYRDKQKPWRFELHVGVTLTLKNGVTIVIPAGYKTDFASVPRLLRGVIQPAGNHNLATLVHDWLYDNNIGTRIEADREMLYWLKKSGCSWIKRMAMYYAVRLGGQSWWDK